MPLTFIRPAGSALLLALSLSACSIPFVGQSSAEAKSRCDQLSAQAIQLKDPAKARTVSAQATECYALLSQ